MARTEIPLVRLNLIRPFTDELTRRGIEIDTVLARVGWSVDLLERLDFWVPAQAVYNFAELAAEAADDRFLGAQIGYASPIRDWPPFVDALRQSSTYGECLIRICQAVRPFSTSIIYRISSDGEFATFSTHRTFNPVNPPGQVDAFGVGHHLQIFNSALNGRVDFEQIKIRVCDPSVVPEEKLKGAVLEATDKRGVSFTFPSSWMTRKTRRPREVQRPIRPQITAAKELPDLAQVTRDMLRARLSDSQFTLESAARFLGLNRRAYQLALQEMSTSYGEILDDVRKHTAIRLLSTTEDPVSNIAEHLGYRKSSNFSRAFRTWTGQTPKQFRNQSKTS